MTDTIQSVREELEKEREKLTICPYCHTQLGFISNVRLKCLKNSCKGYLKEYPFTYIDNEIISATLKGINQCEPLAREDERRKCNKEFLNWLKDFNKLLEWEDNRETSLNKITRDKIKSLSEGEHE